VWQEHIRDGIAPGKTLLFGHGFSVHYGEVEPPPEVDVALVAPKGPGHLVRRQFLEGSGVPGLIAVHQDASGRALQRRVNSNTSSTSQPPGVCGWVAAPGWRTVTPPRCGGMRAASALRRVDLNLGQRRDGQAAVRNFVRNPN
jgi:hypothetical protein